ncbi:hypothetical protein [Streptomyces chilikensis]|uniref:Uncharacterized protein n=1 Tax=Streptomyces chilikensis TaxID=1194079 RepID=A0ABV3EJC0_9ACTN
MREQQPTTRPVEGVVVTHAGTAKGCHPKHVDHPDVAAARHALGRLRPAELTAHHDITEPTAEQRDVRGYVIEPRGGGEVSVYWLEGGQAVRHDSDWHGPALDILRDQLLSEGWTVDPLTRSCLRVLARRPAGTPVGVEDQAQQPGGVHELARMRIDVTGTSGGREFHVGDMVVSHCPEEPGVVEVHMPGMGFDPWSGRPKTVQADVATLTAMVAGLVTGLATLAEQGSPGPRG